MPVLLHRHAAAAGGHDDRLDFAARWERPPGVDQRAHVVAAFFLVVEMEADAAATARARSLHERDAGAIQHARRGGVDRRRERGLNTAGKHEHLAAMARRRPCARRSRPRWHFGERAEKLADAQGGGEKVRARKAPREKCALRALERPAPCLRFHDAAPDVDEAPVLHARWTGRLAGAACEAAVEVQPRLVGDRRAFERAFHEVDAAARAVEVVAQNLVGRAGRGAEAAMHAFAQDRLGLAPFGRIANKVSELGLHGRYTFRMRGLAWFVVLGAIGGIVWYLARLRRQWVERQGEAATRLVPL